MHVIEMICKIGGGASVALVALSFMYVFIVMIFSRGAPMPPVTMFIGLFGIFAFGGIWIAAKLLIDGSLV